MTSIVNLELRNVAIWIQGNKLSLNVQKTNYIIFGNKHVDMKQIFLYLQDKLIERVKSTKFLGIILDDKLTWADHITCVKNKIYNNR